MIWVFDDIAKSSPRDDHASDDDLVAHFVVATGGARVAIAVIRGEWCLWYMGKIVLRDPALEVAYRQALTFYSLTGHGTSRISIEWDGP